MKFLVYIDSVIDLITNSSTEFFLVDESKTEIAIWEILREYAEKEKSRGYSEFSLTRYEDLNEWSTEDWTRYITNDIDKSRLYQIEVSRHDSFIIWFIRKHLAVLGDPSD